MNASPRVLHVPENCRYGHELTARTTHIGLTTGPNGKASQPVRWECLRCLRTDCYRAHHGRGTVVPEGVLDEGRFVRQPMNGRPQPAGTAWPPHGSQGGAPGWWTRVQFASGWEYCNPDPIPELRAEREAAEHARATAELAEQELRDARQRREQRRRDNEAATAAIRSAMSSARGGVA